MKKHLRDNNEIISLHRYVEDRYGEDGMAVIDVRIADSTQLFDPFSMGKQLQIDPEIAVYIDRQCDLIPDSTPLKIRFHTGKLSDEVKRRFSECLLDHYAVEMYHKKYERRVNRRKFLGLVVLGLLLLLLYVVHAAGHASNYRVQILSIAASFSLWEALDLFLIERLHLQKLLLRIRHQMQIEFTDDNIPTSV